MASVDEWTARGHVDSTGDLMREFAPTEAALPQMELAEQGLLPAWIGDEEVHRSHRSNLIRKDPEVYGPLFRGTPADLDYSWPAAGELERPVPAGEPVVIVRASTPADLDRWRENELVAIGERSPLGRDTPAWRAQISAFVESVLPGNVVGVLVGNGSDIHRVEATGENGTFETEDGKAFLTRGARWDGVWQRTDFEIPATLQDPRSVFTAHLRP